MPGTVDERALFARGPVVVFKWKNAEGWPVEYVSANAEEVFGHTPEQFLSGEVEYASLIHGDDVERVGAEVADGASSDEGSFVHRPYRVRHADGSVRWLHDVTFVLRPDKGAAPSHFLGYVIDITKRMQVEEEHRLLERKMQHTQKLESLGVLAGGVAHDFNNLLTGILGEASIAQRGLSDSQSELARSLGRIQTLALRAADLTRQLLAYSGKGRFVVEPVDFAEAIEEMVGMLETVTSKKAVLRLDLGEVPTVEADRAQVQQVLMNLITNASDALEDNPGVITIKLGVREFADPESSHQHGVTLPRGRYVEVEVSDTGCGMDEDTRAKLFDPFFTTKASGRGLGMSAVLGIVRGHGGAIRVCSEPGRGTSFRLLFPASDRQPIETVGAHPEEDWQGSGVVLVVDDEHSVRSVAMRMLEALGFDTLGAENGEVALRVFAASQVDIRWVLLDMKMPVMSGPETLRALRELDPEVRVVMSSGFNEEEAVAKLAGVGMTDFLQKPYQIQQMELVARRVVDE